jgi:transposase-like protein
VGHERNHRTAKEKVEILRRHLVDKVPISQLCDEYHLQPSSLYGWQKTFFESGEVAFERSRTGKSSAEAGLEKKISVLEAKLQRKNEVLGELMEEHVQLKKDLGEP